MTTTKHHEDTCLSSVKSRHLTDAQEDGLWAVCGCDAVEDEFRLELDGGKYTVVRGVGGRSCCLRYGRPWRNTTGDNLIYWLTEAAHDHEIMLAEREP